MTNNLFEFAGNKKTETIIPKAKKKWYHTWLSGCRTDHDKGSHLYGSAEL